MQAELITVGTELLLGQIVNTNAAFLSQELAKLGIDVYYQTVVGDNQQRLLECLSLAKKRSSLIILCGGLGPTEDDLTKETVAQFVNEKLVQDPAGLAKLEEYFEITKREFTKNNLKQVETIEHGESLPNSNGLALGTYYQAEGIHYFLLPGPPSELKAMFRQAVIPKIEALNPATEKISSRVLRFFGIGESQLVTKIAALIENQTNPTVAPYAKLHEVTLRLSAKAPESEAQKMLDELEKRILDLVGDYFYGYGDDYSLAQATVQALKDHQVTVSAAESLTAGLFQSTLGEISGVSEVFLGGVVAYDPAVKQAILDVKKETLESVGMVSEECAKEMAIGVKRQTKSDYAVSFTGVAGPGSLEGKESGVVWIGLATPKETLAYRYHFPKDRQNVRQMSVMTGLDLLRRQVLKDHKK